MKTLIEIIAVVVVYDCIVKPLVRYAFSWLEEDKFNEFRGE